MEKEWLDFGHKMADRWERFTVYSTVQHTGTALGQSGGSHEMDPIFHLVEILIKIPVLKYEKKLQNRTVFIIYCMNYFLLFPISLRQN